MTRLHIPKDIIMALVFTLFGTVLGAAISQYYYSKGRADAMVDARSALLDAALVDLMECRDQESYPHLYDSLAYSLSGSVWPKLQISGLGRLYQGLLSFRDYGDHTRLEDLVKATVHHGQSFNEKISLRNHCIIIWRDSVWVHNPKAYDFFQRTVLPSFDNLATYIAGHRADILGD